MRYDKDLFFSYLAQTSSSPLAIEIDYAEGIYLTDTTGKKYIDLISGIAVSSTGHRHPAVIKAIESQLAKHLHVMVYGELVQSSQARLAEALCALLPPGLDSVFFVNSGSEAVEGALKLAKRFSGRTEIVSFGNAYHGSSHGALSVMGKEHLKQKFRPLLPMIRQLSFNCTADLHQISTDTACVIIEPVQGEAGVIPAQLDFILRLRQRCNETGALLIFDEIQTGLGRTGTLFAFEQYGIVPDVLLLAKAFGGGLPLGAFIAGKHTMNCLSHSPALGHITTFGGHPLSCAAALANLEIIHGQQLHLQAEVIAEVFIQKLDGLALIQEIRYKGLLMAIEFKDAETNMAVINKCLELGLLTDWFLFRQSALRIAPPLTMTKAEANCAAELLAQAIYSVQ